MVLKACNVGKVEMPCYQTKREREFSESFEVLHFDGATFFVVSVLVISLEALILSLEFDVSVEQLLVRVVPFDFSFFFVFLFILVHRTQEALSEISAQIDFLRNVIRNRAQIHHHRNDVRLLLAQTRIVVNVFDVEVSIFDVWTEPCEVFHVGWVTHYGIPRGSLDGFFRPLCVFQLLDEPGLRELKSEFLHHLFVLSNNFFCL